MPSVNETQCPECSEYCLILETRWSASEIGTFSLSGVQVKLPMFTEVWVRCTNCGVEAKGHQ